MQTTIDEAGRVTIPEEIRSRLKLKPGATLDLQTQGECLVVRVANEALFEREGSVLVYTGELSSEAQDVGAFIKKLDEERDQELLNGGDE